MREHLFNESGGGEMVQRREKKEFRVQLQEHAASLMSVSNPIVGVQRGVKTPRWGQTVIMSYPEVTVTQRH